IDYHHGAVIEICDALVVLLALFENEDAHGLAGQHDRLERVGEFVDVEHLDAVKLRDLVEVEVVGDHLAVVDLGELDQLHIDLAHVGKIFFDDLHVEVRHLLNALEDVETAASAIALHRIGRVGDELQLAQHELRDHDDAIEEARLRDIGDAAVDDDRRIENLERLFRSLLAAEDPAERGEIQHVALLGADDESDVGHQEQQQDLQKRLGRGLGEHERKDIRANYAEHRPERCADQALQADLFQADFEKDDGQGNYEPDGCGDPGLELKWMQQPCGCCQSDNE